MTCDPLQSLDDPSLISLWREGNPDALAVLYHRYGLRLRAFIKTKVQGGPLQSDLEDITQETWARVAEWTTIASHGNFFQAICQIAKCRVIGEWDKIKVRRKYEKELSLVGLQGASLCVYCHRPMHSRGLCDAHLARKRNGATEAEMAVPVKKQRRRRRRRTS